MSVRTNFWKKLKNKKVYNFVSTVQRERDTFRNIGLSPKFGSGYTVVLRSFINEMFVYYPYPETQGGAVLPKTCDLAIF